MLSGIDVLCHNSIRIAKDKIIYIDPFRIKKDYKDADLIFCTHSHNDHFSPEDINKVKTENTIIVVTEDCFEQAVELGFKEKNIIKVLPNQKYKILDLDVETVPAYNLEKQYHEQEKKWVGYILDINDITYYIAGDTDCTPEAKSVTCDVAFLPVGGTYTMNYKEASSLANTIEPQIVIPVHYGEIVGTEEDAKKFKELIDENIECVIM